MSDADLAEVMARERELQTAAVRADKERLTELLAPDFEEIGASGRVWDIQSILGMLLAENDKAPDIEVHGLAGRAITDDVMMDRWQSVRGGRRVHRTSLWQRRPEGWRLVHHQGTPAPEADG
ncbi:DUF4440 domain-containing protein [Nocardioides sp. NPDC087217]|uniref:nuclear transport factor 2 family protein n=1 Tax=Nocardioides sp. NPDC087217 TaxID=3364335 RepID=UPI0037F2EF52